MYKRRKRNTIIINTCCQKRKERVLFATSQEKEIHVARKEKKKLFFCYKPAKKIHVARKEKKRKSVIWHKSGKWDMCVSLVNW